MASRLNAPRRSRILIMPAALLLIPSMSTASETLTNTYDALGRLIKVGHSGTVNSNTNACYTFDSADNRSNVTVSTTSDCAAATAVSFSVNNASAREGGSIVFTVTKAGTATGTLTVNYATSDGNAAAGTNYTATSGTLTFLTSDTSKTITVPTLHDGLATGNLTFQVNLANASAGSAIAAGQGVGTINDIDSDCAGVSFTVASNGAVNEGGNSVFTITKAGSNTYTCDVNYATANGTGSGGGVAGTNYVATSGGLAFVSGQTSQTVSVTTIDNHVADGAKTFSLNLSGPDKSGVLGTPSSATATINDIDQCLGISFTIASNGPITQGTNSTFTVTKSGSSQIGSCTVNYATADGTGTAPGDYTATSGTLSFTLSQTTQTISVPTIADGLTEGPETFSVNLSGPNNSGTLGTPSSATATINDPVGPCNGVSFAVSDASVTEGAPLPFAITKTGSSSSNCSVSYATADGTATAPTFYTAASGTLTFTPTQTSQTVNIPTIDHSRINATLKMYMNLSNASGGGAISRSQGTGSIGPSGGGCIKCSSVNGPGTSTGNTTSSPPPSQPPG